MNSREKIIPTINHNEPDCLPVDLGSTPRSGISAIAYDRLVQHLSYKDRRNWVYNVVQQVTQPTIEALEHF